MTLRDFAGITIRIALDDGFDAYLPRIAFIDTNEIVVIRGIPAEMDHRVAVQEVAEREGGEARPFFFGVCSGPGEITTGLHRPGAPPAFMRLTRHDDACAAGPVGHPHWWTFPRRAGSEAATSTSERSPTDS